MLLTSCPARRSPSLSQWIASEELPPAEQINNDQMFAQNFWADQVHRRLQRELFESASLRDKVRLRSEGQPPRRRLAPPNHLGSHLDKGDFLLLIHFFLGPNSPRCSGRNTL